MRCALCGGRRGRRSCPAKRTRICPLCCGSKRLTEIDCPQDCMYLGAGQKGAWEGRVTERKRDERRVSGLYAELSERQGRLANDALAGLIQIRSRFADVDDRLLAAAMTVYRKTLETRERGILFDHQADDLRVQMLVPALKEVFEPKERQVAADRDVLAVVRAFEQGLVRTSAAETNPRAFLESISRTIDRLVEEARERGEIEEPRIIRPDGW